MELSEDATGLSREPSFLSDYAIPVQSLKEEFVSTSTNRFIRKSERGNFFLVSVSTGNLSPDSQLKDDNFFFFLPECRRFLFIQNPSSF